MLSSLIAVTRLRHWWMNFHLLIPTAVSAHRFSGFLLIAASGYSHRPLPVATHPHSYRSERVCGSLSGLSCDLPIQLLGGHMGYVAMPGRVRSFLLLVRYMCLVGSYVNMHVYILMTN
jgi:hypothetical protein